MAKDDPKREARLAEALRQNLRRRKAQERAIEQTPPPDASEIPDAAGSLHNET